MHWTVVADDGVVAVEHKVLLLMLLLSSVVAVVDVARDKFDRRLDNFVVCAIDTM